MDNPQNLEWKNCQESGEGTQNRQHWNIELIQYSDSNPNVKKAGQVKFSSVTDPEIFLSTIRKPEPESHPDTGAKIFHKDLSLSRSFPDPMMLLIFDNPLGVLPTRGAVQIMTLESGKFHCLVSPEASRGEVQRFYGKSVEKKAAYRMPDSHCGDFILEVPR